MLPTIKLTIGYSLRDQMLQLAEVLAVFRLGERLRTLKRILRLLQWLAILIDDGQGAPLGAHG